MITIQRYESKQHKNCWDAFVKESKNATFLLFRNYMDYHAVRFTDHSLLFYKDQKLIALLPANQDGDILFSHQGLTYGGIITNQKMTSSLMLQLFNELYMYACSLNIQNIIYKVIPHIYHTYPAEEDLYALFRVGAKLEEVNISTAILLRNKLLIQNGKKSGVNRAKKLGVKVIKTDDYDTFFMILRARLHEIYNTCPVHSVEEMKSLQALFPENIQLFAAFKDEHMIAGTIVYISNNVIHTQYIASTDAGRKSRAVDMLIATLVENFASKKIFFDFGISNEKKGKYLNPGLIQQKEEMGGRGIVHQIFNWQLKNLAESPVIIDIS